MREGQAVLHAQATVESHLALMTDAVADRDRGLGLIRRDDRLDRGGDDLLEIARIGAGRFLIRQFLDLGRGMVELAWQDHPDRTGGMGMRGSDHHVGDARGGFHQTADLLHRLATDHQGVDADEGHPLLAVVEDARTYLARIVDLLRVDLPVVARDFHADFGSDIAIGEPHADAGLGRRRGEERDRDQDHPGMTECESRRTHGGMSMYVGGRFPGQGGIQSGPGLGLSKGTSRLPYLIFN